MNYPGGQSFLFGEHRLPRLIMALAALMLISFVPLESARAQMDFSNGNWQKKVFRSFDAQRKIDELLSKVETVPETKAAPVKRTVSKRSGGTSSAVNTASNLCDPHASWSTVEKKCLCNEGYREANGRCFVKTPKESGKKAKSRALAENFQVVRDVRVLQDCLRKTGAFAGEVNGHPDAATFKAFQKFRQDKGLQDRPEDLFDPVAQQVLFDACNGATGVNGKVIAEAAPVKKPVEKKTAAIVETVPVAVAGGSEEPMRPIAVAGEKDTDSHTTVITMTPLRSGAVAKPVADAADEAPALAEEEAAGMPSVPEVDQEPIYTGSISSLSAAPVHSGAAKADRLLTVNTSDRQNCLTPDLLQQIASEQGRVADVAACEVDCQPAPAYFSAAQKQIVAQQYNINWCGKGCIGIADPLPLADVLRVERDAKAEVCMASQTRLVPAVKKGLDKAGVNDEIRALYKQQPAGTGNENAIAVLIGNRDYRGDLPVNDDGLINAQAMQAFLLEQAGYKPENVVFLKDAKLQDLQNLFGDKPGADSVLKQKLATHPKTQLLIYFAGHGASRAFGIENYLLPVNAVPGHERETAYPLEQLYETLRELHPDQTQLFLEADFGENRGHLVTPPNLSERRVTIAPIVPVNGLAVFTATEGDQKALVDVETGIGLFTRYLINGLAGKADLKPVGNGDRIVDSVELYVHLAHNIRLAARKTLGLIQNPTFSQSEGLKLSQLSKTVEKR